MAQVTIEEIRASETWALRQRVMWPERPLKDSILPDDEKGIHYGMRLEGELVSVISLFWQGTEIQFRKFATAQEMQGKGYGSRLLQHCLTQARTLGATALWCNARKEKIAFYQRFALRETGECFKRNGRAYVIMRCELQ
ncbi:GNAT family N-acetyltransferase [Azotosporobacter soli]|uniref:GNAT family N-acetyltransferase n=1 Tax=Azotosporobacter soli TaxID=3055040 RepID=UPI0031FEB9F3